MKEPDLEEERLTAEGRGMTLDVRRQTMADKAEPAQVITPSGKRLTVPLQQSEAGLFTGSVETDEIDAVEAEVGL